MRAYFILLAAAVAAGSAHAAETTTTIRDMQTACGGVFAVADTDGDGWVTRAEAELSLVQSFLLADGNADGVVAREEFTLCRAGSGAVTVTRTATVLRSDDVFFAVDKDDDRRVSHDEWFGAVERRYVGLNSSGEPISVATYRKVVADISGSTDAIDQNGDGVVSLDEVSSDAQRAFSALDTNGNGILSPAEFTAYRGESVTSTDLQESPYGVRALAESWAVLDVNDDEKVTLDEYRTFGDLQFRAAAEMAGSDPDVAVPLATFTDTTDE